jgi:hypothetical protein
MPNTMSARPAVAVAAPTRSIEPRRAATEGITPGTSASTTRAIGMLMKKTHGHEIHSVITPPRNTPAVPPAGEAAP